MSAAISSFPLTTYVMHTDNFTFVYFTLHSFVYKKLTFSLPLPVSESDVILYLYTVSVASVCCVLV